MKVADLRRQLSDAERIVSDIKEALRQERIKEGIARVRAEPGGLLYLAIGLSIKHARAATDLTQEELAKAVGVLRTSITNIEAGRQRLPIDLLYDIADVLGVEAASLLPRNEDV